MWTRSALLASARGTGYRRIAARLDRPLSTVRRWIRAVRDPTHVEWLRTQGVNSAWPWSTVTSSVPSL
jgi:transposase